MDTEPDFNRFRYKTRVQIVAVIDILLGTSPFIRLLAFDFRDKNLAQIQDREYLVLAWMTILCVYVLQLIMGLWLLATTQDKGSEYVVGNCQVWIYVGIFILIFYLCELTYDISSILDHRNKRTIASIIFLLLRHAAKIIYRALALMTVNNYLYDICRPVYTYLSQGDYFYKSYYARLNSENTTMTLSTNGHPSHQYYQTNQSGRSNNLYRHPPPTPPPFTHPISISKSHHHPKKSIAKSIPKYSTIHASSNYSNPPAVINSPYYTINDNNKPQYYRTYPQPNNKQVYQNCVPNLHSYPP